MKKKNRKSSTSSQDITPVTPVVPVTPITAPTTTVIDIKTYKDLKANLQDDIKKEVSFDFQKMLRIELEVVMGKINARFDETDQKMDKRFDETRQDLSNDIEKSEQRVLNRFDDTKDDIKDIRDKLYVLQGQKIDRIEATNKRRTIMMTIGLLISWIGLILSHIDKITAFFN